MAQPITSNDSGPVPLDQRTADFIWRVIVVAFVVVLLLVVGAATYVALQGKTPSDFLITIFTSAVAFLAGLLSPSPVQPKSQKN